MAARTAKSSGSGICRKFSMGLKPTVMIGQESWRWKRCASQEQIRGQRKQVPPLRFPFLGRGISGRNDKIFEMPRLLKEKGSLSGDPLKVLVNVALTAWIRFRNPRLP